MFLRAFTVFLVLFTVSCGPTEADSCANDGQCPAFHRCVDQQCRPLESRDAGSTRDAGVGPTDAGVGPRDAGPTPDGDAGSVESDAGTTPDAGTAMPGEGRLLITTGGPFLGIAGWAVAGEFIAPDSPACTTFVEGACTYRECPDTTVFANAGELDVTTSSAAAHLEPVSDRPYFAMGGTSLWTEGDEVRVHASGDAVPSFDLEGPVPMTGSVVEAMFGGRTVFDLIVMRHLTRDAGATVGVLAVEPAVFILRDVEGAGLRELRCDVPLVGATVDLELLSMFPRTMTAIFALGTVTTRTQDVDGWTVTLEILQPATTTEGVPAVGIVQVD